MKKTRMGVVSIALAIVLTGFAQTVQAPTQMWTSRFTLGGNDDIPLALHTDAAGNSYATGIRSIYPSDFARAVLVKHSPSGDPLWNVVVAKDSTQGTAITTLSDNSVIWGWMGLARADSTYIARLLPSNGSLVWQTPIPGIAGGGSYADTIVAVRDGSPSGMVYILNSAGKVVRSFSTGFVTSTSKPYVWNGKLYVFSHYHSGPIINLTTFVACIDLATEKLIWRHDLVDMFGNGTVDLDGNAYLGGGQWINTTPVTAQFIIQKFSSTGMFLWEKKWYPKSTPGGNTENWSSEVVVSRHVLPGQRVLVLTGQTNRNDVEDGKRSAYVKGMSPLTGDSLWTETWDYGSASIVSDTRGCGFDGNNDLTVLGADYRNGSDSLNRGFGILHKFTGIVNSVRILPNLVPQMFRLSQNYPNPFNPSTVIRFEVTKASHVRLVIYSITGEEVATLVDGNKTPGIYETTWNASGMASGAYLYRLTAGGLTETKRMILVK